MLASDQAWARGDVPGPISKLQLARRSDPLSAEPWLRMAALKSAAGPAGTGFPDTKVLLGKAQALDAYDPSTTIELAAIALQEKRWAEGIDLALRAGSLMPLNQPLNEAVASTLCTAVSSTAGVEEREAVRALAGRLKDYELALNRRFEQATPFLRYAKAPFGHTATS